MTKAEVLLKLRAGGVIPVLRAKTGARALAIAAAIAEGGLVALEVTMTVPGALQVIGRLRSEREDLVVGAGTVLDPETARLCLLEGAQFIVSPALNLRTVEMCQRYSVAVLPGALTPTEVVTAWQAGADAIKVFPADAMGGARYLRSLKAPLPQVELVPTGGVSLATAGEYLAAGAFALGVGAELAGTEAAGDEGLETVTANAREYVRIVQAFRERPKMQQDAH